MLQSNFFDLNPLPISFSQKPKTEQHVHVEGTVTREFVKKLADRNGYQEIYQFLEPYLYQFEVKNFLQFLTAYDLISIFINSAQDVEEMIFEYLARCHKEGLSHVDITCSYDHAKAERQIFNLPKDEEQKKEFDRIVDKANQMLGNMPKRTNLSFPEYIDAVTKGIEKARVSLGISANITMILLRHNPPQQAEDLLDHIKKYPHPDITAIGLSGDEKANPASKFASSFKLAKEMGLFLTSHVGELTAPKFIANDLNTLELNRLGHATSAPNDSLLMRKLKILGNPASYFQDLCKKGTLKLIGSDRRLLDDLVENGVLTNETDESPLKQQLFVALATFDNNRNVIESEYKQALSYLFQPLVIELCPTSNLLILPKLNSLQDHPIKTFLKEGIPFSLSSDDPLLWSDRVTNAKFSPEDYTPSKDGCSVGKEWDKVQQLYGLTDEQMHKIYNDSVKSMFCHRTEKLRLLAHGNLYYEFMKFKDLLKPLNYTTLNQHLKTYEKTPSRANAFLMQKYINELNQDLGGLGQLVTMIDRILKSHDQYTQAIIASNQHRNTCVNEFSLKYSSSQTKDRKNTLQLV